ncbi:MAG: hypothetical protein R3D34_10470 [Nitratireductor sp.]
MKTTITRRQFATGLGVSAIAATAGTAVVSALHATRVPQGSLHADAATSRHLAAGTGQGGWKSAATGNVFGKPGFGTLPG